MLEIEESPRLRKPILCDSHIPGQLLAQNICVIESGPKFACRNTVGPVARHTNWVQLCDMDH
jgi:hypothetical protein